MVSLNLIIDGNYLLQKNIQILFKNKILYSELYNVLERDFNVLTRLFNFKDTFFISDSHSNWRKEYFPELKGTRKKDDLIDWKFVYEEYKKLKTLVDSKKTVNLCEVDQMEGDDLIAFVTDKLNKKGESVFIVSCDSDIYQKIYFDGLDYKFMNMMYNYKFNDERVYLPEQYKRYINYVDQHNDEDDIFQSNTDTEFLEFFDRFLHGKKIVDINSEFELFKKIMGHGKDNIKSIFMQGNRGIGETGIETVYGLFKSTYPGTIDFDDPIFETNLLDIIKFHKRIKDDSYDDSMKERLKRNLKIVKLDEKSCPQKLYENMNTLIKI